MNSALPPHSSSNNLRPRNRRNLFEDDHYAQNSDSQPILTASLDSPSSRASSPASHCHTPQVARRSVSPTVLRSRDRSLARAGRSSASVFPLGLWDNPLTTIRGIASDFLGTSVSRDSSPRFAHRNDQRLDQSTQFGARPERRQDWGPTYPTYKSLGSGTQEIQRAELEAKKRERLLIAQGHIQHDSQGRYKRRGSNEREHASMPPSVSDDRDALIYVHRVAHGDTMAGVLIKYNCEAQSFRKANRLWPNDSIQSRKLVVLPVESCGVKGRKVPDTELASFGAGSEDYFSSKLEEPYSIDNNQTSASSRQERPQDLFSAPVSPSPSLSLSTINETSFLHDSWVLIDGFAAPTQVARLSRRALGYFPRTRRKSQNLSDTETASHSFDITRTSFQSEPTSRSPSSSLSHVADLRGSGGVGSMDRNVRSPGPANDGLNKLFPGMERRVALQDTPTSDGAPGHAVGLEDIGGSIESWVRKMASKASASLQVQNDASPRNGDLIELREEAFEPTTVYDTGSLNTRGRPLFNNAESGRSTAQAPPFNSSRSRADVANSSKRRD